jgi:sulfite reductase (NADPH) hemoprotein beta-component
VAAQASTLGRANTGFANPSEIDTFVETLTRFERGEIDADAWRAFRLVAGTYGQRQDSDASMLRAKIPQGILTAEQLEAVAGVAEDYSRGFAHITTRQNFQFHFVKLHDISEAMRRLADAGITTREACGNSVRNVTMSATAGVALDEVFDPTPYAHELTRYFLRHPLSSQLPRKFKIAFTGGGADHAFALVNDLGWHSKIEEREGREVRGFRLTVGGGTALWCQSGRELFAFLPASDMLGVTEAILRVFNARGDRVHRHKNRVRYLIKQMGWDAWRASFEAELALVRAGGMPALSFDPDAPPEIEAPVSSRSGVYDVEALGSLVSEDPTHGPGLLPRFLPIASQDGGTRFFRTNVRPQRQAGYSIVTVTVPLGDLSSGRFRALAQLARAFSEGAVHITQAQNLIFRWVKNDQVPALHAALEKIGLAESDPDSLADVTACPGAESCKLAVTQSRGLARALSDSFREDLALVDRAEGLVVKVSGCPNGCGLHHVAGIGFQGGLRKIDGRAVPQYHVYAGGDAGGQVARFGRMIGKVPARRLEEATRRLIALYEAKHEGGESITDYLARAPVADLRAAIADLERLDAADARPEDFIDLGETHEFKPETSEGECAA